MALFVAVVSFGVACVRADFLRFALTNLYMNGAIIGITIFGILLCFIQIFSLLPEYRWMQRYFNNHLRSPDDYPPVVLRPIAIMLNRVRLSGSAFISAQTLNNFLDLIMSRFEDQRESVRYVTNVLIFLGLLGTFWGLLHTTGGFAELLNNLSFEDDGVSEAIRAGLSEPLRGIGTAFSTSFFGLGGSLLVGFLGLQAQLAQNAMFRELEEGLAGRVRVSPDVAELANAVDRLENTISKKGG
ncbi:MAG: hypothetical protein LBQ49_02510 [Rickettsiales bacterium]|jgi:hypothetical protein|nr:hypothetical protein [Rickettsiales bacterium]